MITVAVLVLCAATCHAAVRRAARDPRVETVPAHPAHLDRRFSIDLRPYQDAVARLRGRNSSLWREDMRRTGDLLAWVRSLAGEVRSGSRTLPSAQGEVLRTWRVGSVRMRAALAAQLATCATAGAVVARSDPLWPGRRSTSA